jgi:hypothetical protein
MQTLFFTLLAAFSASAMLWFFVWAIWIHAPEGWYGKALGPPAIVARHPEKELVLARCLAAYRCLKIATIGLLALSVAAGSAWLLTQ